MKRSEITFLARRISLRRNQNGSFGLSEFALSLMVIVLVVFFSLDLFAMATGYAVIALASRQASFKAATADNITNALFDMQSATTSLAQSGLGDFARLRPVGGYNNSGADLFINVTQVSTGATSIIGPNQGIPRPAGAKQIDSDVNVYECAARLTYEMGPLVSFSSMPFLKDIPGCGKPALVSVVTNIALEQPERLAIGSMGNPNGGNTSGPSGSGITPGSGNSNTGVLGGWNYPTPTIFVALPGQIIEQQKNVIVTGKGPAPYDPNDNNNWHDTGIDVRADNRVSVAWNFFAMGRWCHSPAGFYDADGGTDGRSFEFGLPNGVMVGKIGMNGNLFKVGKDFYNFSPVDTGRLYLRLNDGANGFYDNIGQQQVTVFLTN